MVFMAIDLMVKCCVALTNNVCEASRKTVESAVPYTPAAKKQK